MTHKWLKLLQCVYDCSEDWRGKEIIGMKLTEFCRMDIALTRECINGSIMIDIFWVTLLLWWIMDLVLDPEKSVPWPYSTSSWLISKNAELINCLLFILDHLNLDYLENKTVVRREWHYTEHFWENTILDVISDKYPSQFCIGQTKNS